MKYIKKPVVIDAEVYKSGMEDGILDWCYWYGEPAHCKDCSAEVCCPKDQELGKLPYINTLKGKHAISLGDYIITGIKGERYPCKPDIFAMTYEPVL